MKKEINIGTAVVKILNTLIIRFFTLPWIIYKNALIDLSNTNNDESEESLLINEYPIYLWYLSIFSSIIALTYPLGLIVVILSGGGADAFLASFIPLYFSPLLLGLFRELLSITLKTIFYLKKISEKK